MSLQLTDAPSFDEAALPLALIDLDGRFRRVNAAFAEFLGRAPSDLVGHHIGEVAHPDDRKAALDLVHQALDLPRGCTEKRYVRPDGSVVWAHLTAKLVPGPDDDSHCLFTQLFDVTRQRLTEERADRMRRMYAALAAAVEAAQRAGTGSELLETAARSLVDEAGLRLVWFALADVERGVAPVSVIASEPGREEFDRELLAGKELPLAPDSAAAGHVSRALARGRPVRCTDTETDPEVAPFRDLARRAGIRSTACGPLLVQGRVIGSLTACSAEPGFFGDAETTLVARAADAVARAWQALEQDAARRAAEQELRVRVSQQAVVVRLGEDAVAASDLASLLPRVASVVATTLGADSVQVRLTDGSVWREEGAADQDPDIARGSLLALVTDTAEPVVFPDPACEARCRVPADLRTGSGIAVRLEGRDSSPGLIAVWLRERREWPEGDRAFLQAIAHVVGRAVERLADERARREIEAQLRQAQRLESIGRLVGGIAHDFNNVLSALRIRTDLAMRHASDPDKVRADLDRIALTVARGTDLAQRLTAFSRREPMRPTLVDVRGLVTTVAEMLDRTLGAGVSLRVEPHGDRLPPVFIDRGELEQALVNLVVNARDAMPQGGRITISTDCVERDPQLAPGSYVVLRVADTGTGMSPDVASRAFDPFFTTKPKGAGTGLGLATVHAAVTGAGGDVRLHTSSGKGTTVEILLPVATPERRARPREQVIADVRPGAGQRVLVVDDEPTVREALLDTLLASGYRAEAVASATDALARAAAEGVPDAIVTDVQMPGMSGPQLVAQLRRLRPNLVVLYISGSVEARVIGTSAPVFDKPFRTEQLLARLGDLLHTQA